MSDIENMLALKEKLRKANRSIEARAVKETEPMAYSERRRLMPKTDRVAQTNLKFTKAFKAHLVNLARADSTSMVEYIERAVEFYSRRDEQ